MALILLTIVLALGAGVAAERRWGAGALRARAAILAAMLWVLVPFAIYVNVARLEHSVGLAAGVAAGLAALAASGTAAWLLGRGPLGLDRPATGAAIVCSIQGNTAYLGLPLCAALFSQAELTQAVAYDALVSIPAFVLGSFTVGAILGEARERRSAVEVLLRNPPLVAVVAGLLVPQAWAPEVLVDPSLVAIYAMLPLGFLVVGITLGDEAEEGSLRVPPALIRPIAAVVALKMALVPAIVAGVSVLLVELPAPFLLLAAMPVGVNTVLVAHATRLDLQLTAASIAWSTAVAVAAVLALLLAGALG